jgi:hypothetical protein
MTIEELIEKYKKLLSDVPQKMDEMDAWIATAFVMILEDLKSLQEPTEKRCDICNKEATRFLCKWCYEDIFNY